MIPTNDNERQIFEIILNNWKIDFSKRLYPFKYLYFMFISILLILISILLFYPYDMIVNKSLYLSISIFLIFGFFELRIISDDTFEILRSNRAVGVIISISKMKFLARMVCSLYIYYVVLKNVKKEENYSKLLYYIVRSLCIYTFLEVFFRLCFISFIFYMLFFEEGHV